VQIPFDRGLVAHSDGDVLLHALCDALLGAAGLGDIGQHFPDTDPQFAGIDSRALLRNVFAKIADLGWQLGNADMTIVAQAPKMAPHIPTMRNLIAADLNADVSAINIKATTTERLGFTGRKEGIAALASALIVPAEASV
jgi:2-C-methyl-D-erythritol 2,4-cyclodiphosphate synthase